MYGIIYCITNAVNEKKYVGQTIHTLKWRWRWHLQSARDGSQGALHCAIRLHGAEAFRIEQIAFASTLEELNKKEVLYIALMKTLAPDGYNLTTGGESFRISEETRKKQSSVAIGRKMPEKIRRKISEANRGHIVSEKTRQKISLGLTGRVLNEEVRKKISESNIQSARRKAQK